jgi:hypothetical protein
MSKRKAKHPREMTDAEAFKHLFHKDVPKHVAKALGEKDRKKNDRTQKG